MTLGGAAAVHDNATSVLELGTTTSSFSDPRGPNAAKDLVATGALANPETDHVYFGVVTEGDWVTPARGFFSEVGIEVDTDGDASADHLVVAESFDHPDPASPFSTVAHNGPYARVLDIATGELSQTFEPLNGTHPAYPGGSFDGSEAHDTQIYFNRVLVFPVRLSALGLSEGETFSYRAVSAVSRSPALVGLPLPTPMDATDWVSFDVSVPRLALPGCFDGTPLCPGGEDAIELRLDGGEDTLPTLLVLHHSNASAARFETVDLAEANLFGNDIAITAGATAAVEVGEEAVSTFTVTNGGGADAIAVTASLEVTGGAIASAEASAGTCSTTTCDLGSIGAGESVTITVVATASAAGSLVVTSRVASACGTETGNDEAVASFEVGGGPAAATSSSGAGPTGSASASGSGGGSEGSGGSGGGGERASDDGCGCRMIPRSGPRGVAHGVGLMGAALALRRLRRRGGKS